MSRRRRARPYLWRHDHLIAPLLSIAYFERACAHVLLGWLPKVESIDTKVALGLHQYADATTSAKLERSYRSMTRLTGLGSLVVPRSYRAFMRDIDASKTSTEMIRRIYLGVKPWLAKRYGELIAKADDVLDTHLLETLAPALAKTRRQIDWAKATLRDARGRPAAPRVAARPTRSGLDRDEWLWRPLDRVPHCVRPAPLVAVDPGKIAHRLEAAPGSRRANAELFHHLSGTEVGTMELFARCSYEHADMPEEFHQDYARIVWDEARHAQLCLHQAARLGMPYGAMTIDVDTYDGCYQFPTCKPGSRRELLWRLITQGTFQESLFIEGLPMQAKKMRFTGFEQPARLLETLAEEEVAHVAIALKWSRYLCDGDKDRVMFERDKAHSHRHHLIMSARRTYVAAEPDAAIAETEKLQRYAARTRRRFPFSLTVHVNRPARRAAGFTENEIEQVLDWGYVWP